MSARDEFDARLARGGRSDRLFAALTWGAAASVALGFAWILVDLCIGGMPRLSAGFFLESPRDAGRAGGILSILVSTGLLLAVALAIAVPLGLASAIFLAESLRSGAALERVVRQSLDVLAAVPSIVFGLFGYAFFSGLLGLGSSILAGGLTLACMVLPIFVRACEQGLRAVPEELLQGAAALGLSRTATLRHVSLPNAAPAIVVGIVLGVGRALAETAALVFTAGYVDRMPRSLFDSGRALSVHVYDLSMNVAGGEASAYASALVLLAVLLVINATASLLTRRLLAQGRA